MQKNDADSDENDEEEVTILQLLENQRKKLLADIGKLQKKLNKETNEEQQDCISLQLDIALLKLQIKEYQIVYENATSEEKKEELRQQINTKELRLLSLQPPKSAQIPHFSSSSSSSFQNQSSRPQESGSRALSSNASQSKPDFGIKMDDIVPLLKISTLEDFIQYLRPNQEISIDCNEDIFKIYEKKRKDLAKGALLSEVALQQAHFHDWQKYGENILENTTGKIYGDNDNDGERGKFRKLNFASQSETTKFPDLTLRIVTEEELTSISHSTTPVWRLFPWAVIAYLDLKGTKENVKYFCQQGLYYAQSTLLCSPKREYCITAIYNFKQIMFCGALYGPGGVRYYRTPVIEGPNASREITKFLTCPKHLLGFVDFYPLDHYYLPIAALGRGSTSLCVSIPGNRVIKISRDEAALAVERDILNYLNDKFRELYKNLVAPFPTIISDGEVNKNYTLMSPVYRLPGKLSLNQFIKAWDALRKVHEFGICHRDVRLPNLGVLGEGQDTTFHWMDFSSAQPFKILDNFQPSESSQLGSTCTASIPVLTRMKVNIDNYECYPSDEGISMIYLVWQQISNQDFLKIPRPPTVAIDLWTLTAEEFPKAVKDAITQLTSIGSAYEENDLIQINEIVKNAITVLFSFKKFRKNLPADTNVISIAAQFDSSFPPSDDDNEEEEHDDDDDDDDDDEEEEEEEEHDDDNDDEEEEKEDNVVENVDLSNLRIIGDLETKRSSARIKGMNEKKKNEVAK